MIDEKELIKELSKNSIFEKITIGEETVFDIINRLPRICAEMKFKTMQEMAQEVAEKALDEYEYEGKSIRQWVEVLKDYDDKQTTLERIVKRLEEVKGDEIIVYGGRHNGKTFTAGYIEGTKDAMKIIKEGLK